MNWYMAKLVYRIVCGEGKHTPQFDEQLRLIRAANQAAAFERAQELGFSNQHSFLNYKNEIVEWRFINVSELNQLSELADGVEMYSRVEEAEHAGRFIDTINRKADHLRSALAEQTATLS